MAVDQQFWIDHTRDARKYARFRFGDAYEYRIVDSPDYGSYVIKIRTGKESWWGKLTHRDNYSFLRTQNAIFRIKEEYDRHVEGGGSIGQAIVGGALFGGIGAIAGAAGTGTQINKLIRFELNFYNRNYSTYVPVMSIRMATPTTPIDTQTFEYKRLMEDMQKVYNTLIDLGAQYDGQERV